MNSDEVGQEHVNGCTCLDCTQDITPMGPPPPKPEVPTSTTIPKMVPIAVEMDSSISFFLNDIEVDNLELGELLAKIKDNPWIEANLDFHIFTGDAWKPIRLQKTHIFYDAKIEWNTIQTVKKILTRDLWQRLTDMMEMGKANLYEETEDGEDEEMKTYDILAVSKFPIVVVKQ